MPLYDFDCQDCGQTFELLVFASDTPACPHCQSQKLHRHVSLPTAEGPSKAIIQRSRARAAREGHLSNIPKSELKR